jgi:CRP/FNR family transcriptional regulator, cyclic AMP receptor protein
VATTPPPSVALDDIGPADASPLMLAAVNAAGGARGLLGRLPPSAAEALTGRGLRRRLPAGSVLFHEGDPSDRFVVLVKGRVKASSWALDGREVLLNLQGPGEAVGLPGAVDGGVRTSSVTAIEPIDFFSITSPQLRAYLADFPEAAIPLMEELCDLFRRSNRKQLDFGTLGALGRVARQIAALADDFGEPSAAGGIDIALPLTHQDLAAWVGTSREAVGKAMQQLERMDLVATRRRHVTVLDLDALRTIGE